MPDSGAVRRNKFFIGANTSAGFVNYGDDVFGGLDRLFVIKGGPGTGKSTLMKALAKRAEERGYEVEYYYCSSDPDSLDGVVLPSLRLGIADGTPPHVLEPRFPGAREELINLGEFWDGELLSHSRERIEELSLNKERAFSSAYKYLSVAESVRSERERALLACYDKEKSERAIARFMRTLGVGKEYLRIPRQISALSMRGPVELEAYETMCERTVYVRDKRGISPFIFDTILKRAEEQRLKVCVSTDPLRRVNAVAFPEKGVSVLVGEGEKVINTERFIITEELCEVRKKLRFLSRLENELICSAVSELQGARESHLQLEKIYGETMDFHSLEEMGRAFVSSIIK